MAWLVFLTSLILRVVVVDYADAVTIGPLADLRIFNGPVAPDGLERQAVLAEGAFPGPLISAQKNDHFQINVIDELQNATMLKSTSIHWHGIQQRGTNWANGLAFVNQCPIATGHSFLYDFHAPGQTGTYWYHSHYSVQYCDGLRGPLVIYDPQDPHSNLYDVDDESTVITLSDWYHIAAELKPPLQFFDSVLINGRGRFHGGPAIPLTMITVEPGKRYRFRLVSLSCDPHFTFSIDGHNMTIIEVDGSNTKPLVVDSLQIFAGQRYSVVVHANQAVDNYRIRVDPDIGVPQPNTTGFAGGINSAILRYLGAPEAEPTTNQTGPFMPLNETDLRPLDESPVPGKPFVGGTDVAINLDLGLTADQVHFTVNNVSYVPPTVPVLLQIFSGAQQPQQLMPSGSIIPLPRNASVEISVPAGILGGPHPFHLQGHSMHVVRSAGSQNYNFVNPVVRDVVNLGDKGDNVTIRFTTDNPGPWGFYCHIIFHMNAGLAVILAEDTADTVAANPVPQAWNDLCPTFDSLGAGDL